MTAKIYTFVMAMLALLAAAMDIDAQPVTQTIRGSVFDMQTLEPLIGASVIIQQTDPVRGAATDTDGNYTIEKVRMGRHSIRVNYLGYEPVILAEVLVTSGKEVILDVGLRQVYAEMEGITVTPRIRKDKPLNAMSTVSARSFSVEETRRYAGGIDDPARLVSAFAGVTVGNVQDNAIIVRGNSPRGVSWRIEGVEVPTPHHFVGGNVAGGGIVTLFSSQMLANSDFHTSAFPAEYGNATAGVFDMKLRNGNNDKREYTFQAGMLGIDVSSEGPFSSGSNASYLFNYRYSTFGLLSDLNLLPTDQMFRYQDLSFKVNLPAGKAGTFSVWGIGGIDKSTQPLQTDPALWEEDWDRVTYEWDILMGGTGISHMLITGKKTYISTTLAATGLSNSMVTQRLDDELLARPDLRAIDNAGKVSIGSFISHSLSRGHTIQSGLTYKRLFFNLDINSTVNNVPETYRNIVDERGGSHAVEFYTQSSHDLSNSLTLKAGLNAGYFALIDSWTVDPRLGLTWSMTERQTLSFGYGKHSQMEDLKVYFVQQQDDNGTVTRPNQDLRLAKAHHFVLGYDWQITDILRLKLEPYFQHLYDVPGIADSSYSMINYKQDWSFSNTLVNNSAGRNMGIDVTFERFLRNNYYFLVTGSVFSSRYRGGDGVWRDTRFNKHFVVNVLAGREFNFRDNSRVLGVNARLNYVGGERVSPVLMEESTEQELVIFDENSAFENQLPSSLVLDLSVTFRVNRTSHSSVWALQIKNLLGEPMHVGHNYHYKSRSVQMDKHTVVIPALSYKIEF
ncbi:MAG: TonB-dependent receptor [Cyclonatronaceae bacterium]